MLQRLRTVTGIACLLFLLPALATQNPFEKERALFLDANQALDENRVSDYRKLARQLVDYPLYPYLQFRELRSHLGRNNNREIAAFIAQYAGDPVSWRLRRSWLYSLARQRDWSLYLKTYHGKQPVKLQCYKLQAQINTRQTKDLVPEALQLWLVGKSQVKACDPVFKYLQDTHQITADLLWQRIRLAMEKGNPGLAEYLARGLSHSERKWVSLWRKARRRPARTLTSPMLAKDSPLAREIILYSVRRIARTDADQAHEKWAALKTQYAFTAAEVAQLERKLALSATWQKNPRAHEWLASVPPEAADKQVQEWRIRTALSNQDWAAVLEHISALPTDKAQREEWRYWKAMAQENTGQRLQAMDSFAQLATVRDYHGFLAADFLDWPYKMGNKPLDYDPADVEALGQQPAFLRAHELLMVEMFTDARREWEAAISKLSTRELQLAAKLAQQWSWHDQTIMTVARSGEYSDLKLRFPLEHTSDVEKNALSNQLDAAHVYAVIRQESAFNKGARSHAGAMGLMQLMPRTGYQTARKNNIALSGTGMLYEPGKNISIGSAYLSQMMDNYDNNIVLASAAYNAGPHRVKRWLPEKQQLPATNWIAMIPYKETRTYVQRILAYIAIYEWRMDRPVTMIGKYMPLILPADAYKTIR